MTEKDYMRRLLSYTRKAVEDYDLIQEGDKVLVGTGKNSKDGKNGGKPPMRMF